MTYTVVLGDTLYSLAKRYGTTVQAIMQANGMMSSFLRAGDVIWIPASGELPPGPVVHIVQAGETLYSIARDYNTTVWAIMAANNLSSYSVWAYTALFIPSAAQPGAFIHIVQPGETLYTIATNHGTTVALIMMANALQTYDIYVYQRLVIPPEGWTGWPPISYWTGPGGSFYSGSVYVVQMGDTLYGIAQRFGTTVASLMAANGLTSSTIIAGTTLRIP
jgi:LysM repeat protein